MLGMKAEIEACLLVFLEAGAQAFFKARLADDGGGGGGSGGPSKKKKRKLTAEEDPAADDVSGIVCEHCGGTVPQISLRVNCTDGSKLELTVAQRGLVSEVERAVGNWRGVAPGLIDLFLDGREEALASGARLSSVGVEEGSVLYMLQSLGTKEEEA